MTASTSSRAYCFGETKSKRKGGIAASRELRILLQKQRRWMTRIKRAMTAIAKIDRQIKRLDTK